MAEACIGQASPPSVCVLGIGNLLWADEGFGVRCVEALQQRFEFEPAIELIDGGTQGLYLIQHVQAADRLLIFDAIDYGLPAGSLKLIRDDDVPSYAGARKMSLHQTGFQEVLQLARLTGRYPSDVLLIGAQPDSLDDYGGSLRPALKAALEQAIAAAVEALQDWGIRVSPRRQALHVRESVTVAELAMAAYEAQRPAASLACRIGDERFLAPSTSTPPSAVDAAREA